MSKGTKSYIKTLADYESQAYHKSADKGTSLSLLYHGYRFKGEPHRVYNQDLRSWGQAFDKEVFGCGGGTVFNGKMVWVYYVADIDVMSEPLRHIYVFIMDEKDGAATLEKTIELPGIRGYWTVDSKLHGDWLMVYSPGVSDRSLGILNLRTEQYKVIAGVRFKIPGDEKLYQSNAPNDGYFAISRNGNIYANVGDMLSVWNWKELKWKPIRKLQAESWNVAYDLGHDDLLVGSEGMALAHRGKVFALPQSRDLYISPKLGIGVVYNAAFPFAEGVLLSPKDLTKICKVERFREPKGR